MSSFAYPELVNTWSLSQCFTFFLDMDFMENLKKIVRCGDHAALHNLLTER